jgi:Ca-activated chloride channel family protein
MKRIVLATMVAGWLADLLARQDPDIEAGIAAYEAEDYDGALARYDAAQERLGGRPEIDLDRGLALLAKKDAEGAKTAFEAATESRDAAIRASAHYELGNIALDAEEWDVAIEQYIDCLKARPDHGNAKWNLELAQQKKKAQEDKEKEEEEKKEDEEEQDDEKQDDEKKEDEKKEDEKQEDEKQEDEKKEDEKKEDEKKEEEKQDEKQEDEKKEEEEQDEKKEDEKKEGEQKQQPAPIDRMNIERALQQLDQEDPFALDKPVGGYVQPEKDW